MQYATISHTELAHTSDDPRGQQPGWYVCEYTDDGGEGRVIAGPFIDEATAQARADLFLIGRQNRIEDYVAEFIGIDVIWTRPQMLRILKGSDLTESEVEAVITQVLEALEFEASFDHRPGAGLIDADMGGCAA